MEYSDKGVMAIVVIRDDGTSANTEEDGNDGICNESIVYYMENISHILLIHNPTISI